MSRYQQTKFLTGATQPSQFPPEVRCEIAFAGRSNAGKSSLINVLCGKNKLAKVAKTPGRTQMVNFFTLDAQSRLIDLPGYGYARVSQVVRAQWQDLITAYFKTRQCLRGVVLVADIRRLLTESDWQLLKWHDALSLHLVLTKADKLKRQAVRRAIAQTKSALCETDVTVQTFSASTYEGLEQLRCQLDAWLA